MTAEKFIGSLLQFISSEQELIDKKYIVVALNKSMMKLKGLSDEKIIKKLESNGFKISKSELQKIMYDLEDHGVIEKHRIRKKDEEIYGKGTFFYKWIMDFTLPTDELKTYNKKVSKIVDWSIQLWRSLYNIRELNLPLPENYPNREFLATALQKAAIQGFKSSWWVIKNIKQYYEMHLTS
jgi:transcription initiation factor IIE alpha subunit